MGLGLALKPADPLVYYLAAYKLNEIGKLLTFAMQNSFPQFIFIDKYLKFKEIVYLIHDIKFEMCRALFYVNFHPYFRQ